MMVSTVNDWQRRGTLGILVGVWLLLVVPMAAAQEVSLARRDGSNQLVGETGEHWYYQ